MQSLVQASQEGAAASHPLPEILKPLTAKGVIPERGQMQMWVAPANGGKSLLSMFYAVQAHVPTMVFSADTDRRTTQYRSVAMATGHRIEDVKGMYGTSAEDIVAEAERDITDAGVLFDFNPNPELEDIDLEIQAYETVWGEPPALVVIDNLINLQTGDAGDFSALIDSLAFLHGLARTKDCAVIVLHHVNERDGQHATEYPAPRNAIRGRVAQYPEVILSLAMVPDQGLMRIAVVKHRHATPSPNGEEYVTVYVNPETGRFYGTAAELQRDKEWA